MFPTVVQMAMQGLADYKVEMVEAIVLRDALAEVIRTSVGGKESSGTQ